MSEVKQSKALSDRKAKAMLEQRGKPNQALSERKAKAMLEQRAKPNHAMMLRCVAYTMFFDLFDVGM